MRSFCFQEGKTIGSRQFWGHESTRCCLLRRSSERRVNVDKLYAFLACYCWGDEFSLHFLLGYIPVNYKDTFESNKNIYTIFYLVIEEFWNKLIKWYWVFFVKMKSASKRMIFENLSYFNDTYKENVYLKQILSHVSLVM